MALRILLPTIGSSGDVNPFIELGRALKARGHEVTIATNEMFSEQVAGNGLGFAPLGTREEAETLMRDPRLWHPRRGLGSIVELALLPNIERLYRLIKERDGPGMVVAASTLCLGARVAQETLGVPTATLHLQPIAFRSLFDNGKVWRLDMGPGMPRAVKRALFWLMDAVYAEPKVRPGLNAFRSTLGLAPVRGIFSRYFHSPQLVLGLFPEWYAAPQPDWPPNTHLTGFVLHDDGGSAEARAQADAFLDAGPAPVLVTPGSAAMDRTMFFRRTVEACRKAGVRAMLVTNHPGQLPPELPSGIRAFSYLPFSSVLPRCSAIVYHGGIGTLAQAIKAGVPQLVVSNAHDQPDNAQRIERLGLGIGVSQSGYGRGRAARALAQLLGSADIRRRCTEFKPRIDSHTSLERACALIEGLGRQEPDQGFRPSSTS
jgi:UDP:flavonoid glycosyltransferase YjiC (YdhE family)